MKKVNKESYQLQARILKALAHPARLRIVHELASRERCVCELTEMIGSDISTISRHLFILRSAGIIDSEKRGTSVYYRLGCPCVIQLLGCVEAAIRENIWNQLRVVKSGPR